MPPPKPNKALLPEGFITPEGERYSVFRAVSYDNWLIWRDALPDNPTLWTRLEQDTFLQIQELGRRLNLMHQALPDYKRLSDTPFTVGRWWDPLDDEGDWDSGSRCLLRIDGYAVPQLPLELCSRLGLEVMPVSTHWAEFSLTEALAAGGSRTRNAGPQDCPIPPP
jgi:hypothetical protein